MGQSNMAGFGCVKKSDPWQPEDRLPHSHVWTLGGQSKAKSATPQGWIHWRPATHPLHLNQRSGGFGLGLPFADRILQNSPATSVGLIPCAWGGAGIDTLGPGTPLYQNAIRRARIAEKSGTLAGILWHQGETDAQSESLATAHSTKLAHLFSQLREDLAAPQIPLLIGDLAPFGDEHRKPEVVALRNLVRQGLRKVATSSQHATFVESSNLSGVDHVHFGRSGLIEFGHRYAAAYLQRFI